MPIPREKLGLSSTSTRQDVRAKLEELIVTGALPPGSAISDDDLATLTGASRGPVREALNELEGVGLVEVRARRSTHVTPIDGRVSAESLEIEAELIGQAIVEAVPELSPAEVQEVKVARVEVAENLEVFRHAVATRRQRPVLDLLLARTGNPEYARQSALVRPVVDRHAALHAHLFGERSCTLVAAMLDATAARDADVARASWQEFCQTLLSDDSLMHPPGEQVLEAPTPTLRRRAAQVIQTAILDGTLVPGELITESDLMEWLGVSRTPVREALTELARLGLVEQQHHRPARVAQIDAASISALLRALGVLRRLGVRLATERDAAALADDLERLAPAWDAPGDGEPGGASADVLVAHSGSQRLRELADVLAARGRWSVNHSGSRLHDTGARQGEIVGAIRAGRAQDAQDLVWKLYVDLAASVGQPDRRRREPVSGA